MSDANDQLQLACPKQGRCPGCALGDRRYGVGLARKGQQVGEALAPYLARGAAELELRAVRGADPALGYRLRAKLVSERRALGLYAQGTHRVVDLDGCRVLSASVARAAEALRRRLPLPIHGADLRETSEGVLLTLLTEEPQARAELEALARALVEQGVVLSAAINVRVSGEPRLLSGEPELLVGPAAARHQLSGEAPYAYAVHGGFVQAHAGQASYLQREITGGLLARLGGLGGQRLLELFAGNGSLSLILARAGADVTAVEAYAPAIALAERAAREQGLSLRGVASDAVAFLEAEARAGAKYGAVIVNPPRRGLAPRLRSALGASAARSVAYVSCNPRTLARDLWHLGWLGLRAVSLEPLDMIPWSEAVEALAWLEPAAPPPPQVLFEDERFIAVDKPPHEPVAGAAERCLLARVRALPGGSEAQPVESWSDETSGVCVFARSRSGVAALSQALSQAEHELLLLARGNLRKQGTVTRRAAGQAQPGTRYRKQASLGRHSLVSALSRDGSEEGALRDFASIGHPVLGDARHGDPRSNQYVEHRYGLDRTFLHRSALRFRPEGGAEVELRCELAPDLAAVLEELGSDETAA